MYTVDVITKNLILNGIFSAEYQYSTASYLLICCLVQLMEDGPCGTTTPARSPVETAQSPRRATATTRPQRTEETTALDFILEKLSATLDPVQVGGTSMM